MCNDNIMTDKITISAGVRLLDHALTMETVLRNALYVKIVVESINQ